jgi:hypothetical protein
MARLVLTFVGGGRSGGVFALASAGAVLALVLGIGLLPGLLCGETLTPAEAERSIRSHLRAQAALAGRRPGAPLEVVSVDVDTVVFGYSRIRRSFVVELVSRGADQQLRTRYYCFLSSYLTGECGRWNWFLAW